MEYDYFKKSKGTNLLKFIISTAAVAGIWTITSMAIKKLLGWKETIEIPKLKK